MVSESRHSAVVVFADRVSDSRSSGYCSIRTCASLGSFCGVSHGRSSTRVEAGAGPAASPPPRAVSTWLCNWLTVIRLSIPASRRSICPTLGASPLPGAWGVASGWGNCSGACMSSGVEIGVSRLKCSGVLPCWASKAVITLPSASLRSGNWAEGAWASRDSANRPLSESHCRTCCDVVSWLPEPGVRLFPEGSLAIICSIACLAASGRGWGPRDEGSWPGSGSCRRPCVRVPSSLASPPSRVCCQGSRWASARAIPASGAGASLPISCSSLPARITFSQSPVASSVLPTAA